MEENVIYIYEVFELNRVLHLLLNQQKSYSIQTAFKLHSLIKWLDGTEEFIFDRLHMIFGEEYIDTQNPIYQAVLSSKIPFINCTLTTEELLDTNGEVKLNIEDVSILKKMIDKTES